MKRVLITDIPSSLITANQNDSEMLRGAAPAHGQAQSHEQVLPDEYRERELAEEIQAGQREETCNQAPYFIRGRNGSGCVC